MYITSFMRWMKWSEVKWWHKVYIILFNSYPPKIRLSELYVDFTVGESNSESRFSEAEMFLGNRCSMRVKLNESIYFIASSHSIQLIHLQLMPCDLLFFKILWKFKHLIWHIGDFKDMHFATGIVVSHDSSLCLLQCVCHWQVQAVLMSTQIASVKHVSHITNENYLY